MPFRDSTAGKAHYVQYRIRRRLWLRRRAKEYYRANAKKISGRLAKFKRKHPNRQRAYRAVHEAIKAGKLVRPKRCSKCGTRCTPQGHHHKGYRRKFWLDVVWLCGPCHKSIHVGQA